MKKHRLLAGLTAMLLTAGCMNAFPVNAQSNASWALTILSIETGADGMPERYITRIDRRSEIVITAEQMDFYLRDTENLPEVGDVLGVFDSHSLGSSLELDDGAYLMDMGYVGDYYTIHQDFVISAVLETDDEVQYRITDPETGISEIYKENFTGFETPFSLQTAAVGDTVTFALNDSYGYSFTFLPLAVTPGDGTLPEFPELDAKEGMQVVVMGRTGEAPPYRYTFSFDGYYGTDWLDVWEIFAAMKDEEWYQIGDVLQINTAKDLEILESYPGQLPIPSGSIIQKIGTLEELYSTKELTIQSIDSSKITFTDESGTEYAYSCRDMNTFAHSWKYETIADSYDFAVGDVWKCAMDTKGRVLVPFEEVSDAGTMPLSEREYYVVVENPTNIETPDNTVWTYHIIDGGVYDTYYPTPLLLDGITVDGNAPQTGDILTVEGKMTSRNEYFTDTNTTVQWMTPAADSIVYNHGNARDAVDVREVTVSRNELTEYGYREVSVQEADGTEQQFSYYNRSVSSDCNVVAYSPGTKFDVIYAGNRPFLTLGESSTPHTPGDPTGDGAVSVVDVLTINKSLLGLQKMSAAAIDSVDFNRNGIAESQESLQLLRYIVKLEEILPFAE